MLIRTALRFVAIAVATALLAAPTLAAQKSSAIHAMPKVVSLSGPEARQQLVVMGQENGVAAGELTGSAEFTVNNPNVATVDGHGVVHPVGDGTTRINIDVGGQKTSVLVHVKDSQAPFVWNFRNHVGSVISKMGCNSGACHGARAGKGGLRLSLLGYDAGADHNALTRQVQGRRVNKTRPAQSLMLRKPTMTLPHGGGRRFELGSLEHRVLLEWIEAGAPAPTLADPKVVRLEVLPKTVRVRPEQDQQILVRAHFSDGHSEDVTRWARFTSTQESVALVDEEGLITGVGHGETAITVWYLARVTFATVNSPFPNQIDAEVFDQAPRYNFIDDLNLRKLRSLNLPPSAPCSDSEFIRRAYLDATGVLPTTAEVKAFLADKSPGKRNRLVDHLLHRSEFDDYWAYQLSDMLLVSSGKLPSRSMRSFYNWIREAVAANRPWDQIAREIVTASGSNLENGAVNYFVLHKSPQDLTETTTQAFMGLSLMCARCHDHPLEKWTQSNYYEMANLFARVTLKNGDRAGEVLVYASPTGDVNHPRLGRPLPPRPLDAEAISLDYPGDRRVVLARWLTSAGNPYFARAIVNRVWKNYLGRGLVEAVDDLRLTNPPADAELLDGVALNFTANGFDLRHLMRQIMTSATYQRTSTPLPENSADEIYYSHYIVRRMSAEVMLDALSQVTDIPEKFPGYPKGTRALQLPDSRVSSYFLTLFGRPQRVNTCACERDDSTSVAQALHLANGGTLNDKLAAKGGAVDRLIARNVSDKAAAEYVYLAALSRFPTKEELGRILPVLKGEDGQPLAGKARREALEDLFWAVLTSKEFLFNH